MNSLALWLAQGFGLGRVPVAPGTFGSVAGLGLFFFLSSLPNALLAFGGVIFGIGLSIWLTGIAERRLGTKDPSSIVLDEIIAVPVCFASWILIVWFQRGQWPAADFFFSGQRWLVTLEIVAAFRVFDVFKPWPVRQMQSLPGGYGIVFDDLVAAIYVNLCVSVLYLARPSWLIGDGVGEPWMNGFVD